MKVAVHSEKQRKWIETLLEKCEPFFSDQTRWLHANDPYKTVDLLQNSYYALLLLRSHQMAKMVEGRELLDRILSFQIKEGEALGLIPIATYQYPICKNKEKAIEMLLVFFCIEKRYGALLEKKSHENLIASIEMMKEALLKIPFGDFKRAKLDFILGKKESLRLFASGSRENLGSILHFALAMEDEKELPWIFSRYHFGHYLGEMQTESYLGSSVRKSLFEVGSAFVFQESLEGICYQDLLRGALYFNAKPFLPLDLLEWQDSFGCTWKALPSLGLHYLDHFPENMKLDPSFHLFRLFLNSSHSLVCHDLLSHAKIIPTKSGFSLLLEIPPEDEEKNIFVFYLSKEYAQGAFVNGERMNTWRAMERLTFGDLEIFLDLLEGEADLFGHVTLSHREGQEKALLGYPFSDWAITLRQLRSSGAKLSITVQVKRCLEQVP